MLWDAIGCSFPSTLDHINGSLISAQYISGVLLPVALLFIHTLQNPTLQQDNAHQHVAGILWNFLDTKTFRLLPWPALLPDLSPIENAWLVVSE
ncbi:hypothetical protein TNCV_1944901 [Trichonephila clavipes]|nr:hypothetical protein TNCV_1944901 [Trichonephila clavipes]